jgi:hypothetical protein
MGSAIGRSRSQRLAVECDCTPVMDITEALGGVEEERRSSWQKIK